MYRTGTAAFAAAAALLAGGCSGDGADEPSSKTGAEGAETTGAGEPTDATGGSSPAGSGNHVEALGGATVAFGEAAEYADGLRILVSAPEDFEPSQSAATGAQEGFVRFVVRVVNNSEESVSPADISVTVESQGSQAGDVFDTTRRMSGPPARDVKPGGTAQWVQGFGVADPEDVSVIVQAGLERAPAAFSRS